MENKNDLLFCPNCGVKLEGNELFCNSCGSRLSEVEEPVMSETPPIPQVVEPSVSPAPQQPLVEKPVVPPPNQNIQPPAQQTAAPKVSHPFEKAKKKGKGAGFWVLIIFLIVIIIGGGTLAFLQYNGMVDIAFMRNIIPEKIKQGDSKLIEYPTKYYIVHSFTTAGPRPVAIVSDVVSSNQQFINDEGIRNKFKIAIMQKFPGDYNAFINNVFVIQYPTYPEAVSGHSSYLKSYGTDKRNYEIRTVDFSY